MRINGRNEELEGYTTQEHQDYLDIQSWKYKSNCCSKCLWKSNCKKALSKKEKADILEFGCDDYSPDDSGGTNYINSIIESGRAESRKEYNDNYDQFNAEWN